MKLPMVSQFKPETFLAQCCIVLFIFKDKRFVTMKSELKGWKEQRLVYTTVICFLLKTKRNKQYSIYVQNV